MSQQHLKNLNVLKQHVYAAIPQKVVDKLQNFFMNLFTTNRWILFDGFLADEEVVIFYYIF
jgi:hypothetical protein